MNNADQKYNEYVKNCKKKPRTFGDWLILMSKLEHHRTIIRPMIIWWQEYNASVAEGLSHRSLKPSVLVRVQSEVQK